MKSASTPHSTATHAYLKTRTYAFMIDWASWGYVAYSVMYLLNHFWYTHYVNFYGTLTLPIWGWVLTVIGTLEMAAISHAFGKSIGSGLFGTILLSSRQTYPNLRQRWQRYLWWHTQLLGTPLFAYIGRTTRSLLHDQRSTTQIYRFSEVKDDLPARKPRPWYLTHQGITTLLLIGLTFWLGWLTTQINLSSLFGRASKTTYLWKALVTPDFEHLITADPELNDTIIGGIIESVFMALLATLFGGMLAFPVSFLGARNIMGFSSMGWVIYGVTRAFFNIFRSIESILWAVVFAVWVGFGPFAGVLALMIHTIAALGKLYSEQVESIDPGPLEAIAATGARRWQVVLYGVIPQIIPSYLAFTMYRWDINVRMSTVIALVGGGGIGRILFYYKGQVGRLDNAWNQVGAVVITIVCVVWLLDYISGRVREKIV